MTTERAFLEKILSAMEGVIDVADRKTAEFDELRRCIMDLTLILHKRQHITDGTPCWCDPEVNYTAPETGASVIVHKEPL